MGTGHSRWRAQLGDMGAAGEHGAGYEQGVGGANASKLGCGCSGVALDGPEEERKGDGPVSRSQERRDCLQVQGLEPRPKPGQVGKPDQRHN